MDYIGLCLIAKDEDEYLQEWLDYHILIGVERFYIYDNGSKNPIRKLLKDYIDFGWVIVHEIEGNAVQIMAYQHCIETYKGYSTWIGFVDADEFIVLTKEKDIKQFLYKYEEFGGLAMSSVFFGDGGYENHPVGGQITNYRERFPLSFDDNQLVKCIVQPSKTESSISPHNFIYQGSYYCVNTRKDRVDTQRFPVCYDEVQVNHYFMRSEFAFQKKLSRLGGAGRQLDVKKMAYWKKIPLENEVLIFNAIDAVIGDLTEKSIDFPSNTNSFKSYLHNKIKLKQYKKKKLPLQDKKINSSDFVSHHYAFNEKISKAKSSQDWILSKKLLLKSIELNPMNSVRYTGYASTCLILEEIDEARKALEIAISKFGKTYEVLRVTGDYWVALKQYHKAEECFFEMLTMGNELDTFVRIIYVKIMQKKNIEAVEWGKQVVEKYLYTDSLDSIFVLKVLRDCIRILYHLKRLEDAEMMGERLKIRFPNENFAVDT